MNTQKIASENKIRKIERELLAELKKKAKKYISMSTICGEVALYEAVLDPNQSRYHGNFPGRMLIALNKIKILNLSFDEVYETVKINKDEWYSFNCCENYVFLVDELAAERLIAVSNIKAFL